jgi:hypothetical protein
VGIVFGQYGRGHRHEHGPSLPFSLGYEWSLAYHLVSAWPSRSHRTSTTDRVAAEKLDHLRDEGADLAADPRNRLDALALERQAVERIDGNRQERRIETNLEPGIPVTSGGAVPHEPLNCPPSRVGISP